MTRKILTLLLGLLMIAACADRSRRAEIEERQEDLEKHQKKELRKAQRELAEVDSLLEIARFEHDTLHAWVMNHATSLTETSDEVLRLNQLRAHRDSLEVRWNTLGAKIKYIKKKMEEDED
jgi:uncharacterized lipoprotein YajG